MDMVSKYGQMEPNMEENIKSAKNMDRENLYSRMVPFTQVHCTVNIGQFIENEIQGQGVYNWPDGRIYTGDWVKNKMHGRGELKWKDGRSYKGVIVFSNQGI